MERIQPKLIVIIGYHNKSYNYTSEEQHLLEKVVCQYDYQFLVDSYKLPVIILMFIFLK